MNIEQEILQLKSRVEQLEKLLNIKNIGQIKNDQNFETSKRDKSKYMFNGVIYPKNRLVLAVISEYVKNAQPTFDELSTVFNKSLQGSLNVVELKEKANLISDAGKRYFMSDNEVLALKDGSRVVVCTQWGKFNIDRFIKRATQLGFVIDVI